MTAEMTRILDWISIKGIKKASQHDSEKATQFQVKISLPGGRQHIEVPTTYRKGGVPVAMRAAVAAVWKKHGIGVCVSNCRLVLLAEPNF
jgi:hypothetical protein